MPPAAHLTRSRRAVLLLVGALALAGIWALAPGAHDALVQYLAPVLLLGGLMLAGIRPDALVERLVRRTATRAPKRVIVRRLGAARRTPVRFARTALLMASSLAVRPPPRAAVAVPAA